MKDAELIMRELCDRRGYVCEIEGCKKRPDDLHHVFFRQRKKYPQLDHPINLQLVCREHHNGGDANALRNKAIFWNTQIDRGWDIKKWIAGLPLKVKHV